MLRRTRSFSISTAPAGPDTIMVAATQKDLAQANQLVPELIAEAERVAAALRIV